MRDDLAISIAAQKFGKELPRAPNQYYDMNTAAMYLLCCDIKEPLVILQLIRIAQV